MTTPGMTNPTPIPSTDRASTDSASADRATGLAGSRGTTQTDLEAMPIEIVLTARPLERVDSEIAVAGFFTDERPLRGGAARADWRLCGGLSRRIESGDLEGKSGEAMLIGCGRALRAPRLMLLGLGDRGSYDQLRVSDETREALDRCRKLRFSHIALTPLGIASDDLPRHAAAVVAGLLDAWQDSEASMVLEICLPKNEVQGAFRALEGACEAAGASRIRVSLDRSSLEPR